MTLSQKTVSRDHSGVISFHEVYGEGQPLSGVAVLVIVHVFAGSFHSHRTHKGCAYGTGRLEAPSAQPALLLFSRPLVWVTSPTGLLLVRASSAAPRRICEWNIHMCGIGSVVICSGEWRSFRSAICRPNCPLRGDPDWHGVLCVGPGVVPLQVPRRGPSGSWNAVRPAY